MQAALSSSEEVEDKNKYQQPLSGPEAFKRSHSFNVSLDILTRTAKVILKACFEGLLKPVYFLKEKKKALLGGDPRNPLTCIKKIVRR